MDNDYHDILDMYEVYTGKEEIIIWCHVFVTRFGKPRINALHVKFHYLQQ
jgi:hypothetical protein